MDQVDVLIPTYRRPVPLALTLTSLLGQTYERLRIVVSDQTEASPATDHEAVVSVVRVLRALGRDVVLHRRDGEWPSSGSSCSSSAPAATPSSSTTT